MSKVPCPDCNGTGSTPYPDTSGCPTCLRTGYVTRSRSRRHKAEDDLKKLKKEILKLADKLEPLNCTMHTQTFIMMQKTAKAIRDIVGEL